MGDFISQIFSKISFSMSDMYLSCEIISNAVERNCDCHVERNFCINVLNLILTQEKRTVSRWLKTKAEEYYSELTSFCISSAKIKERYEALALHLMDAEKVYNSLCVTSRLH